MFLSLQCEIENGTRTERGLHPDPAVVPLDDLLHEGQADARTFFGILFALQPLEDPKYLFVELRTDAVSIVLHVEDIADLSSVRRLARREMADFDDLLRLVVVLDPVGDEIAEELGDPGLVTDDDGQLVGDCDTRLALAQEHIERCLYVMDDGIEIGRLHGQVLPPEPREIEQVIDQSLHSLTEERQTFEASDAILIELVLVILQQETGMIVDAPQRF